MQLSSALDKLPLTQPNQTALLFVLNTRNDTDSDSRDYSSNPVENRGWKVRTDTVTHRI
jgi:hypothetical protein